MNLERMKKMRNYLKLFDPVISDDERRAVLCVLNSKFWASGSGMGKVKEFEKKFSAYTNAGTCIAVNSGTAALHLALSMCDIKNKEVILPSFSFVSTANAVLYNGGIPKFVDIDPATLCIDPEKVKDEINENTKVILPVHFGGMPADLLSLKQQAKKNNLILVEDAAHAVGAKFKSEKIGTHGKYVCFSFHPVKNLAMPTGGAIIINSNKSKKNEDELKSKRWCGITDRKDASYDVKQLGWNYYMNEVSAAIGIVQLQKLDKMNNIRKKIAKRFSNEIKLEYKMPYEKNCVYHLFWIRVKNRTKFRKEMWKNGIETGIHYKPIHKMTLFKSQNKLETTEKIAKEIVSIPIHPNLKELDISKIIKYTNKFS
jgi:perosamine synthetase